MANGERLETLVMTEAAESKPASSRPWSALQAHDDRPVRMPPSLEFHHWLGVTEVRRSPVPSRGEATLLSSRTWKWKKTTCL